MRGFDDQLEKFQARGVRVFAISVDPPETNRDFRRKKNYHLTLLSDPNGDTIRRYGLVHEKGGPEGADIARPAEFIVDAGGTIRWVNLTGSIIVRARPEQVLRALDRLGIAPGS